MAREMTPQERADLKEIARKLVLQINEITPMQWDKHDDKDQAIVLAALQTTRRAALLEARKAVVSEYLQDPVEDDPGDIAYDHAIRDAVEAIDRLAQEG